MSPRLWSFDIWSRLERWKSSISGYLMNWPKKKRKNHQFEVLSSLILCNNNRPFLNWIVNVWWKVDCIWQPETTNSVAGLRRSSKALPRVKLVPRKGHSHFGGLLPVWSTAAFWILVKPLHLRSMLSKSMRCAQNLNACSWHWSTDRIQFSMAIPDCTLHTQCFRSWTNWATKFCPTCHIHWTSH